MTGKSLRLDDPAAWIRLVALRIARKKQHRLRSREVHHSALAEAASEGEDIAVHIANRDLLLQAIRRLPEKQKWAIVLRFYAQLSVAESAEILNVSQGTSRSLAGILVPGRDSGPAGGPGGRGSTVPGVCFPHLDGFAVVRWAAGWLGRAARR